MKRSLTPTLASLAATLAATFTLLAAPAAHAGPPKVTICHKPPGNPANAQTISVSVHAWPAHKGHGDSLGTCPPPPPDEEPEGPAGPGDPDGDGGDSDGGGDGLGGGGSAGFEVVLCDGRSGEDGRRIEIAETGRIAVRQAECE